MRPFCRAYSERFFMRVDNNKKIRTSFLKIRTLEFGAGDRTRTDTP